MANVSSVNSLTKANRVQIALSDLFYKAGRVRSNFIGKNKKKMEPHLAEPIDQLMPEQQTTDKFLVRITLCCWVLCSRKMQRPR